MENIIEVWIDVPETTGRYQISNHGRLKQVAVRQRRGSQEMLVCTNAVKESVADYKTGRIGWYVYFDGEKRFLDRDRLLEFFQGVPVSIDAEADALAIRRMNELYRSDIGGGRESVKTETQTVARKASDTAFYRKPAASAVLAQ